MAEPHSLRIFSPTGLTPWDGRKEHISCDLVRYLDAEYKFGRWAHVGFVSFPTAFVLPRIGNYDNFDGPLTTGFGVFLDHAWECRGNN